MITFLIIFGIVYLLGIFAILKAFKERKRDDE